MALAARVAFAVASFVVNRTILVPDEAQYLELSQTVANGHTADSWFPLRGETFYRSTFAYTGLLRFLYALLPDSRIVAQLVSATFGAATAAVTALIVRCRFSRRAALLSGLVVALVPSQILWSSVALREGEVWLSLACLTLAAVLASRGDGRSLLGAAALTAGSLLVLGALRDQTLVAAAWAFGLTIVLLPGPSRLLRMVGGLAIVVALPIVGGTGPGGWTLVQRAVPALGSTRTNLAVNAETAFTPTTILGREEEPVPRTGTGGGATSTTAPTAATTTTTSPVPGGDVHVFTRNGTTYAADDSIEGSISELPRGLVATLFRPFPWEATDGFQVLLAKVENVVWFALYAVALLGAWRGRRLLDVLLYPFLTFGMVIGIAAVSQGNLGTAFRHRGQVLWALAVLAAPVFERWWGGREEDVDLLLAEADLAGMAELDAAHQG
ncbi:MAG: hypothetical protein JWN67_2482 [Actinomycetia bacterium]|nr:hypothetical protein [Actinomycetes bacterium]